MDEIENNGLVGHPITNMLMREACAADLGAADHVDGGGAVLAAAADAGQAVAEPVEEPAELTEQQLFARCNVVLEQVFEAAVEAGQTFAGLGESLARVEAKLDRVLAHFGEAS